MNSRFSAALGLIALAAFGRLIPHPANATPLIAIALFSGAVFSRKAWAVLIPLVAMFVSDLALGLHDQIFSVYGSIALISMLGFVLSEKRSAVRIAATAIASSVLFFVVTNFTVWMAGDMYPRTMAGLIECYALALPFFRNELFSTLAVSGLLFSAWAFLMNATREPAAATVKESN